MNEFAHTAGEVCCCFQVAGQLVVVRISYSRLAFKVQFTTNLTA